MGTEATSANWFNPFLKLQVLYGAWHFGNISNNDWGLYVCFKHRKRKEIGTIEQINVTPIKKHIFILGKLIPFWVIGVFVFSVGLFVVGRLVYGIVPQGSICCFIYFVPFSLLLYSASAD